METDQLAKLLDSIQGQIRAFDGKAQIALGLDSLLAGLLGAELAKAFELANWKFDYVLAILLALAVLTLMSVVASSLFAIFTVVPRLHLNQPKSHLFFCHLVELYGHNYHAASKALLALDHEQVRQQIATQVQTNAIICDVKVGRSLLALRLMSLSLILYIGTFWPYAVLAYRAGTSSKVAPVQSVQQAPVSGTKH